MSANFKEQQYQPGDDIPVSGIYHVRHRDHHYDHEVTCVSGEQFPYCHQCTGEVRFILVRAAHSIHLHSHFVNREALTLKAS